MKPLHSSCLPALTLSTHFKHGHGAARPQNQHYSPRPTAGTGGLHWGNRTSPHTNTYQQGPPLTTTALEPTGPPTRAPLIISTVLNNHHSPSRPPTALHRLRPQLPAQPALPPHLEDRLAGRTVSQLFLLIAKTDWLAAQSVNTRPRPPPRGANPPSRLSPRPRLLCLPSPGVCVLRHPSHAYGACWRRRPSVRSASPLLAWRAAAAVAGRFRSQRLGAPLLRRRPPAARGRFPPLPSAVGSGRVGPPERGRLAGWLVAG